jgi:hypothetical protein
MRPLLVVVVDPVADGLPGLGEAAEVVLPDALLFETAEESLDDPVLLWGIGGDELLGKSVVAQSFPESSALEHKAVVTAYDRHLTVRSQSAEAGKTGFLQSPFCFLGSSPKRELVSDDLPVMAVDDGGQVTPAVIPAADVGEIDGPALVGARGDAPSALDPWAWGMPALMAEPALGLKDAIYGLLVHEQAVGEAQDGPETAISVGGMTLDELADPVDQERVRGTFIPIGGVSRDKCTPQQRQGRQFLGNA